MSTFWIVSETGSLARTLAVHLHAHGEVWTGPAEAGRFKDAPPPDVVIVAPGTDVASPPAELEKALEFLRGVARPERAAPPVLYVGSEADGLLGRIDDRPVGVLAWPFDPEDLILAVRGLAGRAEPLPGLRERARRAWVRGQVELFYAGLELPALRRAIAPRSARLAVLLCGEPGTRRGLLARYIHDLSEPARERLVLVAAQGLAPGGLEAQLDAAGDAPRVTLLVSELDRAAPGVQEELAHLLLDAGAQGVEGVRWIATASHFARLGRRARAVPWLRVDLPPLRERDDVAELAAAWVERWRRTTGRDVALGADLSAGLAGYAWPGNLSELEAVLERSLVGLGGHTLGAEDLRFAPLAGPPREHEAERSDTAVRFVAPTALAEPEPEATATLEELEPLAEADRPDVGVGDVEALAEAESLEEIEPLEDIEPLQEEEPPAEAEPREELEAAAPEPATEGPPEPRPAEPEATGEARAALSIAEVVRPLAAEIRQPLRAIRTYANLLEQRPGDESVRRELQGLVEGDLSRVEELLQRLERFGAFGPPELEPLDLPALVADELRARQGRMRERSLVVLRELDHDAPPVLADEKQVRFALGGLLDRALRMVPSGGDLYVGSLHREAREGAGPRHRLLIRFHSPEDVLVSPTEMPGTGVPIELTLARELVERMGGALAVDASGSQDNVVLIELPT